MGTHLLRAMAGGIRRDARIQYRKARQPSRLALDGVKLVLERAWATEEVRRSIYEDWYEAAERRVIARTLRPTDRCLELGAGIGFITTCLCRVVGSDRVVALEANPELASVALATARRNGFTPTVISAAISQDSGTADFYLDEDFWGSSLTSAAGTPLRVPSRSFREELARVEPTYIVLDVEGTEVQLLAGDPLPKCVRAVCIETHPLVTGTEAIQQMLIKLINEGFVLDLGISGDDVAFMSREDY